jgi:hypothetical protein
MAFTTHLGLLYVSLLGIERRNDSQDRSDKKATVMGLSSETEPFPNNGWAQSSLGDVIGGFDLVMIDKSPEGSLHGEQLTTLRQAQSTSQSPPCQGGFRGIKPKTESLTEICVHPRF